jgi:hypothetical protein
MAKQLNLISETMCHTYIIITNLNNIPLLPTSKEFSQRKLMIKRNFYIKEQLLERFDVRRSTIITGRTCQGANKSIKHYQIKNG